jgi:protocatechuate 3,4-dioxygenase beta subunit
MRKAALVAVLCACRLCGQPPAPGTGVIRGVVRNAQTNAPVRRATVTLTARAIRLTALTDAEGKFDFSALPPGTYRLTATRTGFLDRPARRPIPLSAAESAQTEIRLPPAGAIAGRVVDESGEGMDRCNLVLYKQTWREGRRLWDRLSVAVPTDDSGGYRFTGLKPGRYLVQASNPRSVPDNRYGSPPQAHYVLTFYPSVFSQQQASPVEVGAGAEVTGIDIRLSKVVRPASVRVRGKLTGVAPDSHVIYSVALVRADGGPFGGSNMTVKTPDFAFELSAPPGAYSLVANIYSGLPDTYASENLVLTGDVSNVALPMRPAPRIEGRVRIAEQGVAARLESIRSHLELIGSGMAQPIAPDSSGRFTTQLLRGGPYILHPLRDLPDGCYVRDSSLGEQRIDPAGFDIAASGELDMVVSCTAAAITGTAVDADGKPFAGASVTLIPPDDAAWQPRQAVDDAGAFRFANLRPGKYTLFAWEDVDDDLWPDPDYRKKFEDRAVTVEVGPKETKKVQLRAIAP